MGTSDWVVVMSQGRVIAEGPPAAVGTNHEVIDAYLGRQHDKEAAE
jgi:neutral amino acid transport system ATP-binding protein